VALAVALKFLSRYALLVDNEYANGVRRVNLRQATELNQIRPLEHGNATHTRRKGTEYFSWSALPA
jgi:hypothetical protein